MSTDTLSAVEHSVMKESHSSDCVSLPGQESNRSKGDDSEIEKPSRGFASSTTTLNATDEDLEKNDATVVDAGTPEPQDPDIVDWAGSDDPTNPINWSEKKKLSNVAIVSLITFITSLASSMFAPSVPQVLKEFDVHNNSLATWVVSVYILGFAAGPLLVAPLSEMYGRVYIYNISNLLFVIFTIACAVASSMTQLIIFRFFAGACGIAAITNGGGTIADMIKPEKRGLPMSIWALGPLIGPVIGPVCGSFLSAAAGWRWIFWLLTILSGLSMLLCFAFARETYGPTLLERKAKQQRKETGNMQLRSKLDKGTTTAQLWKRSLVRPIKLLFLSPICGLISLHMACVYGVLYLLFTTFTFVFEGNYGFSKDVVGLVYIGIGVGMVSGLIVSGLTSDRVMKHLAKKHNGGKLKPEYRLPMMVYGTPFVPIGLFIYGWTAQYHVQWFVPIFATALVGIGILSLFMGVFTYLVDTYTMYAASAIAASTILRSIFGAVFPLFALDMYNVLGLGWGNSLLGFVTLVLSGVPFLFYKYGEKIRTNPRFQLDL